MPFLLIFRFRLLIKIPTSAEEFYCPSQCNSRCDLGKPFYWERSGNISLLVYLVTVLLQWQCIPLAHVVSTIGLDPLNQLAVGTLCFIPVPQIYSLSCHCSPPPAHTWAAVGQSSGSTGTVPLCPYVT